MNEGSEISLATFILMVLVAGLVDGMQGLLGFLGIVTGLIPFLGIASVGVSVLVSSILSILAFLVFYFWFYRYEINILGGGYNKVSALAAFIELFAGELFPGWLGFVTYVFLTNRRESFSASKV